MKAGRQHFKTEAGCDFNIYTLRGYKRTPCRLHFCNAVYKKDIPKPFPGHHPLISFFRYNDDIYAISVIYIKNQD